MQTNPSIDQKKQYLKSYRSTLWDIQLLEDEIHMFQSLSNTPSYIIHPVQGTQAFSDYTSYRTQIDTQIIRLQAKRLSPSGIIGRSFSVSLPWKILPNRYFFA